VFDFESIVGTKGDEGRGSSANLRVVVDAKVQSGGEGGIEQVLIGLCHGFSQLDDCAEEIIFACNYRDSDWLRAYIGGSAKYVRSPRPEGYYTEHAKNILGPSRRYFGIARRAVTRAISRTSPGEELPDLPRSDGFYESLMPQLLHVTYPLNFVRSAIPTILTMYDLQHRHFPKFFSSEALRWRETVYPKMLNSAQGVITISKFCKDDIVKHYGISASKICVIPLAPAIEAYPTVTASAKSAVANRYQLPKRFMLYPALTYEHKNHVRLLESLASLRAEGVQISLVCTGAKRLHWPVIERRIKALGIEDDVRFVGFVSPGELAAIYELAEIVVLPSLFEGVGLPLLEALSAQKPVVCSDIAAFREYGADAPLYFDPFNVCSISESIKVLLGNPGICSEMARRGAEQVAKFSWKRSARLHRTVYRKVAGWPLSSAEEEALKAADSGNIR
jgi:glycosyltransferase involved in cell wall biosynthesis